MNWFSKLVPSKIRTVGGNKRTVPEGLWIKCDGCSAVLYRSELERSLDVCPWMYSSSGTAKNTGTV